MEDEVEVIERIGRIDMTVRPGSGSAESRQGRGDRVEALAAWLFSEWQREHAEDN